VELWQSVDAAKDQSYVLHVLGQTQLRRALFPIGEYPKSEVRALARRFDLPVAERPDSQDLCFLGAGDYRQFLQRHAPPPTSGPITDRAGRLLGQHHGLAYYTIGQRKGLGLASTEPLYVLEKDLPGNRLVVGLRHELGATRLLARPVNWIAGLPPTQALRAQVKIRYTAALAPALVTPLEDGQAVEIVFDEPLRDITPGQAAVIFDGERCLGGGIIQP
jgi:tRNA-specific 2-thiouridylase